MTLADTVNNEVPKKEFLRPYLVVEKIFERVGLTCSKSVAGRLSDCTTCNSAGTQFS
jgi:hypothetical protein